MKNIRIFRCTKNSKKFNTSRAKFTKKIVQKLLKSSKIRQKNKIKKKLKTKKN